MSLDLFHELVFGASGVSCPSNSRSFVLGGAGCVDRPSQRTSACLILRRSFSEPVEVASLHVGYVEISDDFPLALLRHGPLAAFALVLLICRGHLALSRNTHFRLFRSVSTLVIVHLPRESGFTYT